MKMLAINGSPRKTWNTASLLQKALEGARSAGAGADMVHLYDYRYTGCVSCFGCKRIGGKSYGRCIINDSLTPILEAAHDADVLLLGTPFYFSSESSAMRAFMERFFFQYLLYTTKKPPLSPKKKAISLLYTMNVREEDIPLYGKDKAIERTKGVVERLFGKCDLFLCGDTKQLEDYSTIDMDYFDPVHKDQRHEEQFPHDLERAFAFGKALVS